MWKRCGGHKPQQNAAASRGESLVQRSERQTAVDRSSCSRLTSRRSPVRAGHRPSPRVRFGSGASAIASADDISRHGAALDRARASSCDPGDDLRCPRRCSSATSRPNHPKGVRNCEVPSRSLRALRSRRCRSRAAETTTMGHERKHADGNPAGEADHPGGDRARCRERVDRGQPLQAQGRHDPSRPVGQVEKQRRGRPHGHLRQRQHRQVRFGDPGPQGRLRVEARLPRQAHVFCSIHGKVQSGTITVNR